MTEASEPFSLVSPDRILVAEDNDAMRDLLVRWLREAGYGVTTCRSAFDLRAHLERSVLSEELPGFDVVLSDLPLGNTLDALDEFFGCDGVPPTILITAFGRHRRHAVASHAGVASVLEKPFEKDRLMAEIQRLRARDAGAANLGTRVDPPSSTHSARRGP